MCAPSAGVVGAPCDVVGDRRGDVEGRREAGVAGEPGGVEVGVVAGAVLPSGPEVEPQAGGDRLQGIRELAVGERPAAGDVVGVVPQGLRVIRREIARPASGAQQRSPPSSACSGRGSSPRSTALM